MCADPQKAPESSPSRRFGLELQTLTQGNPPPTLLCPTLPCPPLMIPQIHDGPGKPNPNQKETRRRRPNPNQKQTGRRRRQQTLTRKKLEDEEEEEEESGAYIQIDLFGGLSFWDLLRSVEFAVASCGVKLVG